MQLCQTEMEQVLRDKVQEQVEDWVLADKVTIHKLQVKDLEEVKGAVVKVVVVKDLAEDKDVDKEEDKREETNKLISSVYI